MSANIGRRQWKSLLDSIERGECIPVIGPDLASLREDGSSASLTTQLARELADWLAEDNVALEQADVAALRRMAQLVENVHSRDELTTEVRDYYRHAARALSEHEEPTFARLAALPFPLYLSTRHDATLEWYLAKAGKQPTASSYQFRGNRVATLGRLGTSQEPVIYHFFGHADDPDSMVLTENDTLDFLKSVVAGEPGLPVDLLNLFQQKNFLFLGSGLGDYPFRVLLHVLNLNKDKLSLGLENPPLTQEQQRFEQKFGDSVLFYGQLGYKLKLLDIRVDDFIEQLHQRWTQDHPDGTAPAVSLASTGALAAAQSEQPSVFISYAKEDEVWAKRLCDDLRALGLNPWLDTDTLRAGIHWDKKLEDAVSEQDYFIVLQSKALSRRRECFVHKEVNLALQRAQLRPPGSLFIFPLQLEQDAEHLEALADIQTGTLFDWQTDVEKLARDIKRDSERQRRDR